MTLSNCYPLLVRSFVLVFMFNIFKYGKKRQQKNGCVRFDPLWIASASGCIQWQLVDYVSLTDCYQHMRDGRIVLDEFLNWRLLGSALNASACGYSQLARFRIIICIDEWIWNIFSVVYVERDTRFDTAENCFVHRLTIRDLFEFQILNRCVCLSA